MKKVRNWRTFWFKLCPQCGRFGRRKQGKSVGWGVRRYQGQLRSGQLRTG